MGKTGVILGSILVSVFLGEHAAAQVENSVFKIMPDIGNKGGTLTGFFYRQNNITGVVTCLHGVVPGNNYVAWGERESFVNLSVKYVDIDHDLAFLSSDIISQKKEVLEPAKSAPVAKIPIKVLGFPAGMRSINIKWVKMGDPSIKQLIKMLPANQISFFSGRQSPNPKIDVLYIDGQMIPGHSGAPVLDDANHVYGVVFGGVHAGAAGITWAIPVTAIQWTDIAAPGVAARVQALSQHKPGDHQLYDFIFEDNSLLPTTPVETGALSGTWNLSMKNCYLLKGDDTPIQGHAVSTGILTLNFRQDNTIIGKFSSNTSNCGTGDVTGKINGNNVDLTITCTKGSCFNGSFKITGVLNGKAILGKNEALPSRPSKCIMYISDQVTLQKQ